jgi:head-tail adaptor
MVSMSIGTMKPIVLEKWQQMKNASGSLTDTLVQGYTVYADVETRNLVQDGRTYDHNQTKVQQVYKMKVRSIQLKADALWKVIYRGKRLTVLSVVPVDEKNFWYSLTVECK